MKPVYALVKDLFFATKIVKTAQAVGLEVRAFDTADRLFQAAREKEPSLVLIDCEGLEKEAFNLLGKFRAEERFSKIPEIGYLSHAARDLKAEMRRAGCEQVYSKSEFTKELENLFVKYNHDLSPRV